MARLCCVCDEPLGTVRFAKRGREFCSNVCLMGALAAGRPVGGRNFKLRRDRRAELHELSKLAKERSR